MRFVAQIKLLMAILPIVLALGACGSSSSSSDSDDQNTALCDSIIALTMGAPRVNISIAQNQSHCYSFAARDGGDYRITLDSHSGDADVGLFPDSRYLSSTIMAFSINAGPVLDEISYRASETATRYIEVFGYEASRYTLTVSETVVPGPTTPTASIAPVPGSTTVGSTIALDGGASSDPNGDPLTYQWSLVNAPPGSMAQIMNADEALASLVPDLAGSYTIRLVVNDGSENSSPQDVFVTVTGNSAPVAVLPAQIAAAIGQSTVLDGSASTDADGDPLTHRWRLLDKPISSALVFPDQNGDVVLFDADELGDYRFELVVNDGMQDSAPATVVVSVTHWFQGFDFRVTDAEYSDALNRVVMVSADSASLYTYAPGSGTQTTLALPLAPTAVSVSPDGLFAAVGHNGWISYIDLAGNSVVKTFAVSTDVYDIVLDGRGYVHAFPRVDQWERIRSVEIATEIETLHSGNSIRAGTRARLHPFGDAIYGADNGLSPSDIEKYDVSASPVQYLYDSPYHGDFAMCGDLWFSEDGQRIYTRCGNTFESSPLQAEDMLYSGSFENIAGRIVNLDHDSQAKRVAVIYEDLSFSSPDPDVDTLLYFYEDSFLAHEETVSLPRFTVIDTAHAAHARHVFYNDDGTRYVAIVQADASSGALDDYALLISPTSGDPTGTNRAPVAQAGLNQAAVLGDTVTLDGSGSSDADGDSLSYSWRIISAPAGSVAVLTGDDTDSPGLMPDLAGRYEIGLVVDDGMLASVEDTVSLTVALNTDSFLLQLDYDVTDAEYSDALERIVSVSAVDSKLYTFDTLSYQQTELALPLPPTAVSVSPDGLFAAVGHDGWISYVDLAANSLVKTFGVSTDVFDIVLDGRGYVHAMPRRDQWERIRSVEIDTEIESLHSGRSIRAGTRARLHPFGDSIYGADNGLSPSDIEKYDVTVSPVVYVSDSPYHGTYPMCGDLWFDEAGQRIITRCGYVFRASSDPAQDMTYNGSLPIGNDRVVDIGASSEAGLLAAIIEDTDFFSPDPTRDTRIHFYTTDFLVETGSPVTLNPFEVGGTSYPAHGRFVFFNSDGSRQFAVVQADPAAALVNDFGISLH